MNEFLRRVLFLPPQASTLAREIDYLHYAVISVTMAGATLVAAAAAYFILRYHRRPTREPAAPVGMAGHHAAPPAMPVLMAFWFELLVIGFLLVLFVAWWVIGFRQFVKLETPPQQSMEIYVTAKQWMWTFAYPNGRTSNAVLYVPANRPVTLLLSARDVIHSFFVPHFRVKKDVIPGRMTTLWFEANEPGVYPVYCTEYCGEGHSTMRAQVIALPEHEYLAKLEQLPRLDIGGPNYVEPAVAGSLGSQLLSLAEMGERVAVTKGCMRCHTADGTPHIGPTWLGLYRARVPLVGGQRQLADEAYLTESMMDPLARVRAGFQPVMPPYQGLLSAAETGALLEYMRYLSTADPETRLSPLAPPGSPALRLPSVAPQALERNVVPQPLRVIPEPRPDSPPYSPPGTEPSHPNVERRP
jgi:cytochrome c oxidase subunit 2